jgi:hypothetical protein
MGNQMCCVQPSRTTAAAKVIRWDDGSFEEFWETLNVGELMMDNPQQFVCNYSNLQAGRRIAALSAEEDLALGGVYVLLPMQKYLRRVLSASDMASLNLLAFQCKSGLRKPSCNSVIFPAVGSSNLYEFSLLNGSAERSDKLQIKEADRLAVPKQGLDEDEDEEHTLGMGSGEQWIRTFGYWEPALATILESPRVYKR